MIDVPKLKTKLVLRDRFFGRLILSLPLVQDDSIKTFATDASAIYYNQDYANTLTAKEVTGVLIHEVLHCAYNHIFRCGKRNAMRWNAACDYSINLLIINAGYTLPEGGLINFAFANMSPEEIYKILPEGSKEKNSFDETLKSPKDPKAEKKWQAKAAQTHLQSNMNTTQGMQEIIKGLAPNYTPVDWRTMLSDWINDRSHDNYTWGRPNRNFIAQGLYLPSADISTVKSIAFLIDTSASMDATSLEQAVTTLQDLLDSGTVTDITVIQTDMQVHSVKAYATGDTISKDMAGRGGTNFTDAMALASTLDVSGIIAFTDLEISAQRCGIDPDLPVIWLVTGTQATYDRYKNIPTFGEVIHQQDCTA